MTWPTSHSWEVVELGLETRQYESRAAVLNHSGLLPPTQVKRKLQQIVFLVNCPSSELREQPVTTVITALPFPHGGWSAASCSEFLMPGVGLTASVASLEALCGDTQSLPAQLSWRRGRRHTAFLKL